VNARCSSRRAAYVAAAALIWAVVLALDWWPALRGGFGWRWGYAVPHPPWRVLPLLAAVAVYLCGLAFVFQRRTARALLVWVMAGSIGLVLAAQYVSGNPFEQLFGATASGVSTGWHLASVRIEDWPATLAAWPAFMRDFASSSSHVSISPPGLVVLYFALTRALSIVPALADFLAQPLRDLQCQDLSLMAYSDAQLAATWFGILSPLWAAAAAWPAFALGRRLVSEAAARWAAAWWPLVPGIALFVPSPSTLFPLLALVVVLLVVRACQARPARWAIAAGLVMSLFTFLTFAGLPLLFLVGLVTLGLCLRPGAAPSLAAPIDWPRALRVGIWFGAGLGAIWLAAYAAAGVSVVAIVKQSTEAHVALDRPYLPWVLLHLNDVLMFTGWPVTLLAGLGAWLSLRALANRHPFTGGQALTVAVVVTLLLLDLSGIMRGESGRILLYLAPLLLLGAAMTVAPDSRSAWVVTGSQAVMLVVLAVFVRGIHREFDQPSPEQPPAQASAPAAPIYSSGAVFGQALVLNRFAGQVEAQPGQTPVLNLWLEWEAQRPVDVAYYLSVLPVPTQGEAPPQALVTQPFDGQFPTTCWRLGKGPYSDQLRIPLAAPAAGEWWASVRLVNGDTGEALPVQFPDGAADEQAGLGPFLAQELPVLP
jgi:hypothetical protein